MACSDRSKFIEYCLFFIGIFMCVSELWKQYTLTFRINGGYYDWWYFPFQLCSIPMYLLVFFPVFRRSHIKSVFFTFLMDYSLLGGICVFLDTSGMYYPLASLTVHSWLWHILIIIAGILCGISKMADYTWNGFLQSGMLFSFFCIIATFLNLIIGKKAPINMFYISPYYEMSQVIIADITRQFGNNVRIFCYIAAIILGAAIFHLFWRRYLLRTCKKH
nr:YwaF family protein [uncultured Sellimonas sp.]